MKNKKKSLVIVLIILFLVIWFIYYYIINLTNNNIIYNNNIIKWKLITPITDEINIIEKDNINNIDEVEIKEWLKKDILNNLR